MTRIAYTCDSQVPKIVKRFRAITGAGYRLYHNDIGPSGGYRGQVPAAQFATIDELVEYVCTTYSGSEWEVVPYAHMKNGGFHPVDSARFHFTLHEPVAGESEAHRMSPNLKVGFRWTPSSQPECVVECIEGDEIFIQQGDTTGLYSIAFLKSSTHALWARALFDVQDSLIGKAWRSSDGVKHVVTGIAADGLVQWCDEPRSGAYCPPVLRVEIEALIRDQPWLQDPLVGRSWRADDGSKHTVTGIAPDGQVQWCDEPRSGVPCAPGSRAEIEALIRDRPWPGETTAETAKPFSVLPPWTTEGLKPDHDWRCTKRAGSSQCGKRAVVHKVNTHEGRCEDCLRSEQQIAATAPTPSPAAQETIDFTSTHRPNVYMDAYLPGACEDCTTLPAKHAEVKCPTPGQGLGRAWERAVAMMHPEPVKPPARPPRDPFVGIADNPLSCDTFTSRGWLWNHRRRAGQ